MTELTMRQDVTTDKVSPETRSIESDREFMAHVYQQLAELQPFLTPESKISVVVNSDNEDAVAKDGCFELMLVATMGDYRLEAEGRNADIYEALGIAKRKMLQQLDEVYGSVIDSNERASEIDALLRGDLTIH